MPNRRTIWLITSVSTSGVGASDRCRLDANRALHLASLMFNRLITDLRAVPTSVVNIVR
jgi:hypothetical protein